MDWVNRRFTTASKAVLRRYWQRLGVRTTAAPAKPLIVAHRGLARPDMQESSIVTMGAAIEAGADVIEFDVRWTKDDVMILSHDLDLARTTKNCTRSVADLTWDEVQKCETHDGSPIPTFAAAMAFLADQNVQVHAQLAPPPGVISAERARQLTEVIGNMGPQTTVTSFRTDRLREIRPHLPVGTRTGLLWNNVKWMNPPDEVLEVAEVWLPDYRLVTRDQVAAYRKAGLEVIAWTTVDDAGHKTALELGLDGICTDDVEGLAARINSRRRPRPRDRAAARRTV
jgi:glycerophosphoryl diester phosphodiesterase